jgi:hypothetical protein
MLTALLGSGEGDEIVNAAGPGAGAGALLTSLQPLSPKAAASKSTTSKQVLPIVLRSQIMRVLVQVNGMAHRSVGMLRASNPLRLLRRIDSRSIKEVDHKR